MGSRRSTATVLFTDLVGSTELRSRLGEQAAEELRRKHDRLLCEAVEAYGGRVVKGLGDGIMATFTGASDAVLGAVAIQQAIDRLNRSGQAEVPLWVRIGLSAGDVTFEDDDVHGTPVIEASRLCGAASGGEILVADVVQVLAGLHDDDLEDGGSLELKGLPKPVSAWRVRWEPAAASSIPMPALLTDVGRIFVGRDAELERLTQLWKEVVAGERRVAFLAGEPGVGKTRLIAELAIRVHDEGGAVLVGRCDEDLGVPYQPFVEVLRHFVDHTPPADLEERLGRYGGELVRLMPELTERVPGLPPPLQSDSETERYRLFDAVAAWFGAAASHEPVLLGLDDLQWAAKPTLLLLRHVVQSAQHPRLLILGTYRDTELTYDHPLVDLVAHLRRQGHVERLPLSGLDDVAVVALVEQAAGAALDDAGLAFARAIYQETEGNPFFVREVLRHLAETGAVERHEGGWTTRLPVEELGIPEGIRDVVGRRLSRLADDTNQVLRVAAVAGAEFEIPVLQASGILDEERLLAALEEATAARLVIEASATRYRFAHALVRDTLYGDLTAARRVALHRRVAQSIETCHAEGLDDYLPALAHHWARASGPSADTTRAVDYATRAGDRALAQLAHDEAVTYYQQALDLLDAAGVPATDVRRVEQLISLGEAQGRAGDPTHRETLLAAARLARQHGDPDALARAALANHRGVFASAVGTVDAERIQVFEAALEMVGPNPSSRRARLLAALAQELLWSGDRARRLQLSDEALAIARDVDDPDALVHVLLERFFTVWPRSVAAEGMRDTAQLLALTEALGDPLLESRAYFLRFRAAMVAGDLTEADRCLAALEALPSELGQPTLQWQVAVHRPMRVLMAGDIARADHLVDACFELGQLAGQPDAHLYVVGQRFTIRFEQGRVEEVEGELAALTEAVPRLPLIRACLAVAYSELNQPGQARNHFEKLAAAQFATIPLDTAWPTAIALCAMTCGQLGDAPRAEELHRLITPYSDQLVFGGLGLYGSFNHHLAVLDTTLGRFNEAHERFAAAATTHERIVAPTWLARTRLEWARMLIARQGPGDANQAAELLGQALTTARDLGLAKIERDALLEIHNSA